MVPPEPRARTSGPENSLMVPSLALRALKERPNLSQTQGHQAIFPFHSIEQRFALAY